MKPARHLGRIRKKGRTAMAKRDRNRHEKAGKPSGARYLFWTLVLVCALSAALILQFSANHISGFSEIYTRKIYPVIVKILGGFWGKMSFSVVEILLYAFILFWLVLLILSVTGVIRRKAYAFRRLLLRILALAATCGVLFFAYEANCGVNYYSAPFSEAAGLTRSGYDEESLKKACLAQTQELIRLNAQVQRDDTGCLIQTPDWKQKARQAMKTLGEQYPQLAIDYPQPKPVLISRILSVQSVTGVYSPFTVEANYNTEMPAYNIPFTMCHELSHLCGFMREDEANFIGWLACRQSQDAAFRYSSAMLGWINCTNELAEMDSDTYRELYASLPEEVRNELRINTAFWERFEGKAAEIHEQVNDAYLKANGQAEGVRSYERMVELIVSYYQSSAEQSSIK